MEIQVDLSGRIGSLLPDKAGADNEVVEGVLIGGDQVTDARLLSRNVGDAALDAIQSRNDPVFGLLYDFVGLVELGLGVRSLLDSCHSIALRKEKETFERLHVGVQIPSRHYLVFWHFFPNFVQGLLHVLDILFVWLGLRAEVGVNENYFVDNEEASPVIPVEFLVKLFSQGVLQDDFGALRFTFEGFFFGNDQGVLGSIVRGIVIVHFLNLIIEIPGVLLEKHDIGVDSLQIVTNFFTLPLLIQEAEVVKGLQLSYVLIGILFLEILQVLFEIDITQESVPHRHVILLRPFLFLLGIFNFNFGYFLAEDLLPLLAELSTAHNSFAVCDPHIKLKHGGVPIPELHVQFSQLPVEFRVVLPEIREVLGDHLQEKSGNIFELFLKIVAVELKGTVHDPAVVERGYLQSIGPHF